MAGTAMSSPTGTVPTPARISATGQGRPQLSRCPKAAAPAAANPTWHSEIWPESRTRRPRDRNSTTCDSAVFHSASRAPTTWGRTTAPMSDRPQTTRRDRADNRLGGAARAFTWRPRSTRRPFGMTSRTTNSTRNGMLRSSPTRAGTFVASLEINACAIPMTRPPANEPGRLVKPARAAAPKACTMSRASTSTWTCCWTEANSTPEAAANTLPSIQAWRRTRVGFSPVTSRRAASSTTARTARPRRVARNNTNSPTAAATPSPRVIRFSTLTETPWMENTVDCGRKGANTRASSP